MPKYPRCWNHKQGDDDPDLEACFSRSNSCFFFLDWNDKVFRRKLGRLTFYIYSFVIGENVHWCLWQVLVRTRHTNMCFIGWLCGPGALWCSNGGGRRLLPLLFKSTMQINGRLTGCDLGRCMDRTSMRTPALST